MRRRGGGAGRGVCGGGEGSPCGCARALRSHRAANAAAPDMTQHLRAPPLHRRGHTGLPGRGHTFREPKHAARARERESEKERKRERKRKREREKERKSGTEKRKSGTEKRKSGSEITTLHKQSVSWFRDPLAQSHIRTPAHRTAPRRARRRRGPGMAATVSANKVARSGLGAALVHAWRNWSPARRIITVAAVLIVLKRQRCDRRCGTTTSRGRLTKSPYVRSRRHTHRRRWLGLVAYTCTQRALDAVGHAMGLTPFDAGGTTLGRTAVYTTVVTLLRRLVGVRAVATWSPLTEIGRNVLARLLSYTDDDVVRVAVKEVGALGMPRSVPVRPVQALGFEAAWIGSADYADPETIVLMYLHGAIARGGLVRVGLSPEVPAPVDRTGATRARWGPRRSQEAALWSATRSCLGRSTPRLCTRSRRAGAAQSCLL